MTIFGLYDILYSISNKVIFWIFIIIESVFQQPEAMVANRKEEHEVNVKRGARRKFNKWEKEGVRSVLYDDGIDRGEDVSGKTGASLGINDLLDRLEMKYRMLRTKLFWNMIHKQSGQYGFIFTILRWIVYIFLNYPDVEVNKLLPFSFCFHP